MAPSTSTDPSPRTARGDDTRRRLLRAAADLLVADGEVEVAKVAARAGVSAGLPYRYFGTRSGLVAAVVEDFHDRLAEAVVHREVAGATWSERERQRVEAWVRFLYDDPLAGAVLGGLGGDAVVAESWRQRLALAVEVGTRNIARGRRDGDLPPGPDPATLAAAVLGGVQAAVAEALARDRRPPVDRLAADLWSIVAGAVGVAP